MKEIACYEDYANLNGADIVEMMRTKPREDIEEFKAFCAAPKTTRYDDGTVKERETSFFEIRNWFLDKYYPGVRTQKKKSVTPKLLDVIANM